MRFHGSLMAVVAVLAAGCEQRSALPPAPIVEAGQGFSDPANFDSVKMGRVCLATNQVVAGGNLRRFSDAQIVNGACALNAISMQMFGRHVVQGLRDECLLASQAMLGEFKRRFPDHDTAELAGRC